MYLIGVDYHPSFQTIAFLSEETGEYGEQELNHSDGQADRFYRDLKQRGIHVRVGMEATGYSRWFERLLAELGFELWIGDPAEIKAKRVRKPNYGLEGAEASPVAMERPIQAKTNRASPVTHAPRLNVPEKC